MSDDIIMTKRLPAENYDSFAHFSPLIKILFFALDLC